MISSWCQITVSIGKHRASFGSGTGKNAVIIAEE